MKKYSIISMGVGIFAFLVALMLLGLDKITNPDSIYIAEQFTIPLKLCVIIMFNGVIGFLLYPYKKK
jgi:hypothetical protein